MKIDITKALLERFYQGKCSTDEKVLVIKWLKAANKKELKIMIKERWGKIESLENLRQERSFDAFWKRNRDKMKMIDDKIRESQQRRSKIRWAAAFAIIVMILVLSLLLILWNIRTSAIASHGESKTIILMDNSVVTHNTGSELENIWR